jgi:hypothetical protein
MARTDVIEVPVPGGAVKREEDLELLRMLFQEIVSLRYEGESEWRRISEELEQRGWTVRLGLSWHVEARRGREFEEVCGATRDEAMQRLWQLARYDALEGCP